MSDDDKMAAILAELAKRLSAGNQNVEDGNVIACIRDLACRAQDIDTAMADAAEMLWVVLANVSGGDWTEQSAEWQEAAARYRDQYFAALAAKEVK